MEIRKVNVKRFDAAFRAMLGNAKFDMESPCHCCLGTYERYVRAIPLEEDWHKHFGITEACFDNWYFPCGKGAESWPAAIDTTDAAACIRNVMKIVEAHHGPQDWLPLLPAEKGEPQSASLPTLDEVLNSIGIARPQVPAAE